jgi:hypothetical protein
MNAKYRYGFNSQGEIQDVTLLEKADVSAVGPFSCIGCGATLVAKLGQKNIKHFAHASTSSAGCGKETYLHLLGKYVFIETYKQCLQQKKPFILALETAYECNHFEKFLGYSCRYNHIDEYDLTKYFDELAEEVWHDGFRPDVLLQSSKSSEVVFVEIAVSHQSSDDKLKSGKRIIEYLLDSEDDVFRLRGQRLDETTHGVRLVNFQPKPIRGNLCNGKCEHRFDYFVVDRKGRASVLHGTPAELMANAQSESVVMSAPCRSGSNKMSEFMSFLESALEKGITLRNCLVCVQSLVKDGSNTLFCRKHQKRITSTEAFRCRDYSQDRS